MYLSSVFLFSIFIFYSSGHAELGDGAGFGDLFAGFLEEGAEGLYLGDAGGGEFGEGGFDFGVLGEGGVSEIETGGAFFGGDDEFHGFIEAGVVAGIDEAWTDADGEFVFLGEIVGGGWSEAVEDGLEAVALETLIFGHAFEGTAKLEVAGFFGEDNVAVGGDGFAEGGDGQGLVVGELGEVGGGELFAHGSIIGNEGGVCIFPTNCVGGVAMAWREHRRHGSNWSTS
jgi:hypothetical protein